MGSLADYVYNMTPCQGTRRDGQPCRRWVFPPFAYCPWHRPKPSAAEIAAREQVRVERECEKAFRRLQAAAAALDACARDRYESDRAYQAARTNRQRRIRRLEHELAVWQAKRQALALPGTAPNTAQ